MKNPVWQVCNYCAIWQITCFKASQGLYLSLAFKTIKKGNRLQGRVIHKRPGLKTEENLDAPVADADPETTHYLIGCSFHQLPFLLLFARNNMRLCLQHRDKTDNPWCRECASLRRSVNCTFIAKHLRSNTTTVRIGKALQMKHNERRFVSPHGCNCNVPVFFLLHLKQFYQQSCRFSQVKEKRVGPESLSYIICSMAGITSVFRHAANVVYWVLHGWFLEDGMFQFLAQ